MQTAKKEEIRKSIAGRKVTVIDGIAGGGKTTTAYAFAKEIYGESNICVCTPTNALMRGHKAKGWNNCFTACSLLHNSIKGRIAYNDKEVTYNVIIADEAGLLGANDIRYLAELAEFKKIILTMDRAQLYGRGTPVTDLERWIYSADCELIEITQTLRPINEKTVKNFEDMRRRVQENPEGFKKYKNASLLDLEAFDPTEYDLGCFTSNAIEEFIMDYYNLPANLTLPLIGKQTLARKETLKAGDNCKYPMYPQSREFFADDRMVQPLNYGSCQRMQGRETEGHAFFLIPESGYVKNRAAYVAETRIKDIDKLDVFRVKIPEKYTPIKEIDGKRVINQAINSIRQKDIVGSVDDILDSDCVGKWKDEDTIYNPDVVFINGKQYKRGDELSDTEPSGLPDPDARKIIKVGDIIKKQPQARFWGMEAVGRVLAEQMKYGLPMDFEYNALHESYNDISGVYGKTLYSIDLHKAYAQIMRFMQIPTGMKIYHEAAHGKVNFYRYVRDGSVILTTDVYFPDNMRLSEFRYLCSTDALQSDTLVRHIYDEMTKTVDRDNLNKGFTCGYLQNPYFEHREMDGTEYIVRLPQNNLQFFMASLYAELCYQMSIIKYWIERSGGTVYSRNVDELKFTYDGSIDALGDLIAEQGLYFRIKSGEEVIYKDYKVPRDEEREKAKKKKYYQTPEGRAKKAEQKRRARQRKKEAQEKLEYQFTYTDEDIVKIWEA